LTWIEIQFRLALQENEIHVSKNMISHDDIIESRFLRRVLSAKGLFPM
jgi:hypothetical protein